MDRTDESTLTGPLGNMERREFLTKAAAAGAVAWAAPVILSRPAYAVEGGEGSPGCIPDISVSCVDSTDPDFCDGFPGIRIDVGDCPCADPAQAPTVCVRIDDLDIDRPITILAYANASACNDNDANDVILATSSPAGDGPWTCIDPSLPILFALPRPNPNVPPGNYPDNPANQITFTLGVWAGNCPPELPTSAGALTYNCQTYAVQIQIPAHPNAPLVISNCTADPSATGLCDSVGSDSPCGTCP